MAMVNSTGIVVERYEYTPYGQRTIFGREWLATDADEDGDVDTTDLSKLAFEWEKSGYEASTSDTTGDGVVNLSDQSHMAFDWGKCWTPADDPLVSYPRLETPRGRAAGGTPLAVGLCDVGHQGLHFNKEFGLYDNRARYYHPRIGRFVQRDPAGYPDGMNAYEYVCSRPSLLTDPGGTQAGAGGSTVGKFKIVLHWFAGPHAWADIHVFRGSTELAKWHYIKETGRIVEVATHRGKALTGLSRSAMKKLAPHLAKHMREVVTKAGGTWSKEVARTAVSAGPSAASGGALSRALSKIIGGALTVLFVLDATASTADAAEVPIPQVSVELSLKDLGLARKDVFVEDGTPGTAETQANQRAVTTTGEVAECPESFRTYKFKRGDTCWCRWRKRTNKSIRWPRAEKVCADTCESGEAGDIKAGEVICVPE